MACINYCVSSFPPNWQLLSQFLRKKASSPCHHPTYAQVSHRRVADGMGQACDRNCAATLHCTSMLPASLEFPKAGSPALCPAQAAPLPGHNPLQGCWAPSEQGTALLYHHGGFHLHQVSSGIFCPVFTKMCWIFAASCPEVASRGTGQLLLLCPSRLVLASPARVKADPFGV